MRLAQDSPRSVPDIPSRRRTTRDHSIALVALVLLTRRLMSTLATVPMPVPPLAVHAPHPPPPPAAHPPHAPRISLADRVARAFPPLACVRGFRSFTNDRVEIVSLSEVALDAVVKGKRAQTVRLRIENGRLAASCTCCAKLMGPAACKHVWAALLEIDRRGAFESMRTTQRALALAPMDAPPPRPKKPAKEAAETKTRPSPAAKKRKTDESTKGGRPTKARRAKAKDPA